jgi:hypothetical protein
MGSSLLLTLCSWVSSRNVLERIQYVRTRARLRSVMIQTLFWSWLVFRLQTILNIYFCLIWKCCPSPVLSTIQGLHEVVAIFTPIPQICHGQDASVAELKQVNFNNLGELKYTVISSSFTACRTHTTSMSCSQHLWSEHSSANSLLLLTWQNLLS